MTHAVARRVERQTSAFETQVQGVKGPQVNPLLQACMHLHAVHANPCHGVWLQWAYDCSHTP